MDRRVLWFETYKCIVLTVIAVAVSGIYFRTPRPFTLENLREKKVQRTEIPLVRVQGGSIDADVTGSVEIER